MTPSLRDDLNVVYLVLDVETESLRLFGKNRPWQISYILYQNGRVLEEHNKYILWKDLDMSKDAARITGFNLELYKKKAEDPNKVLDEFEIYLNNKEYIILYHNGTNFDAYIIKNWREALGRKNDYSYLDRAIDTNSLARAIKKGIKRIEREDLKLVMFRFANYVEKGLKTNLMALGKEYGIECDYANLHDSKNDIILTAKIWDKLKFQIEI